MPFRIALVALVLAAGPAYAAGCGHERAASACAEGQVWDTETRSCVDPSA